LLIRGTKMTIETTQHADNKITENTNERVNLHENYLLDKRYTYG